MQRRIALVLKGYPRLSETFIAREIRGLERRGLRFLIVSLRHPTDRLRHALHAEIAAPVLYLPEYLHQEPLRVWRGFWSALRAGCLTSALAPAWRDFLRDRTRNRLRRLGQALVLRRELPDDITCLYVHYLHTPASVARYTARMRGLVFAVSAHAKDIWTIPNWEIQEKLEDAAWLTTCSAMGFRHLRALAPEARLFCLPHGLDLAELPAPPIRSAESGTTVQLLTVARAVEKKGLDILLEALALLPPSIPWCWRHVGGGPLLAPLRAQAERLGIAERCEWLGALAFDGVLAELRRADLFCFAPRVAADGDRDGIPNVVAEAMAQALPVVSADAGAVAEIVEDGVTGLLVPPDDPKALATAIQRLVEDPERRLAMGLAARDLIERHYSSAPGISRIAEELEKLAGAAAS